MPIPETLQPKRPIPMPKTLYPESPMPMKISLLLLILMMLVPLLIFMERRFPPMFIKIHMKILPMMLINKTQIINETIAVIDTVNSLAIN